MTNTSSLVGRRWEIITNSVFLWVILAISILGGLVTLVLGTIDVVGDLGSRSAWLELIVDRRLPAAALGGSHATATGTYDTALVHVSHLRDEALAFVTVGEIAGILVQVCVFALVSILAWRLLHGRALRKSLSTAVTLAGCVLIVGGVVQTMANVIASGLAAVQLNDVAHGHFWPLGGRFDGSLVGIGFVLITIGLVFEYGARLQKDTEGLV